MKDQNDFLANLKRFIEEIDPKDSNKKQLLLEQAGSKEWEESIQKLLERLKKIDEDRKKALKR